MKDAPASGSGGPNLRWLRSRPSGTLRLVFRLPIYLYRLNLGWLLAHRGLLLIHQGRKSGLLRETVLEVIRYDPATKESVVLSGWGEKADCYRNIGVRPALEVRTGGERYVPEHRFLAPKENHTEITDYERRHPLAVRIFVQVFGYRWAQRRGYARSLHRHCAWWPSAPEL